MESLNDIKKRIKSVASTKQITKAMEVVSATKMRKSQETALKARGYAFSAFELLASLTKYDGKTKRPALFLKSDSKKTLLVVVTSDKGLAGSLNASVLRKAISALSSSSSVIASEAKQSRNEGDGLPRPRGGLAMTNEEVDIVTVGKKAAAFFTHRQIPIQKTFTGHGDFADFDEVKALTGYLANEFSSGKYGRVVICYTNFRSTLKQEAVLREILPLRDKDLLEMVRALTPEQGRFSGMNVLSAAASDYLFEPSPEKVLNALTERLFQMLVYHIILESNASEHSARMVAMKTASENAEEIVSDLTLLFNKGRQAKITQELVEITSGSEVI